jgi:hypothetical protein
MPRGTLLIMNSRCGRLALLAILASNIAAAPRLIQSIDVAPVWSGHPVGFALLTNAGHQTQYVAYYDADRQMTLAARSLDSKIWTFHPVLSKNATPGSRLGWDSHNWIALALDSAGEIHLSGNMHASPLLYFCTSAPGDIGSLREIDRMVGDRESSVTYPRFLSGPNGALVFTYRDGRSGSGADIYDSYDATHSSWSRLLDQPLLDGRGRMNAYPVGPIKGPDGFFHLAWIWRNTPDCSTCHDISYARSADLIHWQTSSGDPIALPLTLETGEIVDHVPPHGGAINSDVQIGFDSQNRVVIAYTKYDAAGNSQLFIARRQSDHWTSVQLSRWNYRWNFGGQGTIPFEITVDPPQMLPDSRFVATFTHAKYGRGGFTIDPQSLQTTGPYDAPPPLQPELLNVQSSFPNMEIRTAEDSGTAPSQHIKFILRWETLAANRDRPRQGPLPPPSMLRVCQISDQ